MEGPATDNALRRLLVKVLGPNPDTSLFSDPDVWATLRDHSRRFGLAEAVAFAARPHVSDEGRLWCDRQLVRSWNAYSANLATLELILGILNEQRIDTLCLKGPLLAHRHYRPAFVRRPSVDLDIAVHDRDIEKACEALGRAGYSLRVPIPEARAGGHDIPLLHVSRPRIELHTRLSHSAFGLPVADFMNRALSGLTPGGCAVLLPEPADELLHLALHLVSDRFSLFFHLWEFHRLWNDARFDVRAETIRRAIACRCAGIFALIDVAFRLNFEEPMLPEGIALPATWLGGRINQNLYRSFEDWYRTSPEKRLAGRIRGRWLDFQLTDGPRDAFRWISPMARLISVRLRGGEWGSMRPVTSLAGSQPSSDTNSAPNQSGIKFP